MAASSSCIYCTLPDIPARTVKRNELAIAFLTNIPITPGHTLVIPARHVATFDELKDDERRAIFALAAEVKAALWKAFGATGFNHAWNEGAVAGQSIPHFHLHIVPRTAGDEGITEYEPRKFLYRPGSRETTPEAELDAVAKEIAAAM
ncbi:MAG TPA: HIT family protein [Candidatus Paceibacterota bacterium]|nr:HIT family protein [Candidatus Paceibacterota bacterium]